MKNVPVRFAHKREAVRIAAEEKKHPQENMRNPKRECNKNQFRRKKFFHFFKIAIIRWRICKEKWKI